MTSQEAINWTIQLITAGKDGVTESFDPDNPEPYYRGYNQGYIDGLESALQIIKDHRQRYFPTETPTTYTDPTCPHCGGPLASAGPGEWLTCERCGGRYGA